jgi:hypothetical protein
LQTFALSNPQTRRHTVKPYGLRRTGRLHRAKGAVKVIGGASR